MNRTFAAGVALTVGGFGAYLVGITMPYPGRSLSVSAIMVGVALLSVGVGGS
ncbi:MAG: hypothetical protein QXG03_00835 [Halalkalicoccus sp.]